MIAVRSAALSVLTIGLLAVPIASRALADVGDCAIRDPQGYCIEWDVPTPGGPGTPGDSGADPSDCYWVTIEEDIGAGDPTVYVDFGLDEPPEGVDIVWQSWECADGSTTFNFRWVIPATPGSLAGLARGRLVGELPQPVVESSPPIGTASIVGVPVFVAVANWTGAVSESECAGGLCVTLTATPLLRFTPGESDAEALECVGPGSRYVEGGGSLEEQAASPGACAYAYRLRTGVQGRPTQWPGSVSVVWSLSWVATSGATGTLPAVIRSADLPRGVSEVQTVVVGGVTP